MCVVDVHGVVVLRRVAFRRSVGGELGVFVFS
jgi:hypothetical protein